MCRFLRNRGLALFSESRSRDSAKAGDPRSAGILRAVGGFSLFAPECALDHDVTLRRETVTTMSIYRAQNQWAHEHEISAIAYWRKANSE